MFSYKRFILYITLSVLVTKAIFPFAGKPPPVKRVLHLSVQDKKNRTLSFIAYFNLSEESTYDYLKHAIPKNIAKSLLNYRTITVPMSNMMLKYKNENTFSKIMLTNMITESTNMTLSNISIYTERTDYVYAETNSRKTNNGDITEIITMYFTDSNSIYISPYFGTVKKKELYDNEMIVDLPADLYDIPFGFSSVSDGMERVLFVEKMKFKRNLRVQNNVYTISNMDYMSMIKAVRSDYIVYGDFTLIEKNRIRIKTYIIDAYRKTLKLLAVITAEPVDVFEKITLLTYHILAELQGKELVYSVGFTTEPPSAHMYLDKVFMGTTPVQLAAFPEGEYEFGIWKSGYEAELESSRIHIRRDSTNKFHFPLKKTADLGEFEIQLRNTNADIYIDSFLYSSGQMSVSGELMTGNHFVKTKQENFQDRYIQIKIKKDMRTSLVFDLYPAKKDLWMKKAFLNYKRNMLIFFGTGLVMSGFSLYCKLKVDEYDEKLDSYYSGRYIHFSSKSQINEYLNRSYYEYNVLLGYSLIGTIGSFALTGFFYFCDKRQHEISITTEKNRTKDMKIEYSRTVKEF
ncbi:PEGA domain-containing protein [Spirochaetota bacterium]